MIGRRHTSSTAAGDQPVQVFHFQVGGHRLGLTCTNGRWTVTVNDESSVARWFTSQVAAWEAGVREADRLDRRGGA